MVLSKQDGRTLERWTFDVSKSQPTAAPSKASALLINSKHESPTPAQDASVDLSVPNLLKQIAAAATFLPDLPTPGVFNLLTYVSEKTLEEQEVLEHWSDITEDGSYSFDPDTETQQVSMSIMNESWSISQLILSLRLF